MPPPAMTFARTAFAAAPSPLAVAMGLWMAPNNAMTAPAPAETELRQAAAPPYAPTKATALPAPMPTFATGMKRAMPAAFAATRRM